MSAKSFFTLVGVLILLAVSIGLGVASALADRPASRSPYDDSTRDVVTRLQLRPGETLRLAQPIGAFDVTCSAGAQP